MPECKHPTCGDTCRRQKKEKKKYFIKKKPYVLKRTPIRKQSKKKQRSLGEQKLTQQKDWEFFLEIWEERMHICYETDQPILSEPLTVFFHHVLEKADYPQYRYCKWNIVLVSWETHSKCHNDITFAPKIKAYRDKLMKKLKLS